MTRLRKSFPGTLGHDVLKVNAPNFGRRKFERIAFLRD
jgi:hypothetical protein